MHSKHLFVGHQQLKSLSQDFHQLNLIDFVVKDDAVCVVKHEVVGYLVALETLQDLAKFNHKFNCGLLFSDVFFVSDLIIYYVFHAFVAYANLKERRAVPLINKELYYLAVVGHDQTVDAVLRLILDGLGQHSVLKVLQPIVNMDLVVYAEIHVLSVSGTLGW